MKGQTHGGKGSTPRPTNKRRFDENYEAIFSKKAPEERVELDEGFHITESDGRQRESKLREHVEGAGIQGQTDQEQAVRFNFCPRCGKRLSGNPDWVHTCTPPEAYESEIRPLFVESKPKHQPLSNDEIYTLARVAMKLNDNMVLPFARAIEKVHGIGE